MSDPLAEKLFELAKRVIMLDPPDRMQPHKFTEDKHEIAADLRRLAREEGAGT